MNSQKNAGTKLQGLKLLFEPIAAVNAELRQRIKQLRRGHMADAPGRTQRRDDQSDPVRLKPVLEPKVPVVRYERSEPSGTLHMNTKKLGRIERPSHRVMGDRRDSVEDANWDVAHVAIDDHSRTGFVQMLTDEKKTSAVTFLKTATAHYAALGLRIQQVLTDNGSAYRSRLFDQTC